MRLATALVLASLIALSGCSPPKNSPAFKVEIEISNEAFEVISRLGLDTPIDGRIYFVISRNDEREPRSQTGVSGVPFWGKDIRGLTSGDAVVMEAGSVDVRGYPMEDLADLPAGDYFVQAFLSVYTTFNRSDGHTVSMHLNSGAGQSQWRAPGNAYSAVANLHIDAATSQTISLLIDEVIQPVEPLAEGEVLQQGNPPDTDRIKFVKIKSEKLSEFWGRPMYIGANVLLPEGYDTTDMSYPVMYMQGHFPGRRSPLGFADGSPGRGRSVGFSKYWVSDDAPRMIAITFRDANPFYDTSYSVNSENVGPYGDAITEELIPYLESEFRITPEPWARIVAGGSTGGWEALAMQIFYPDFFGGSWGWCPDPVDFNAYQIVNIYEDDNAYFLNDEWHHVARPNARRNDGNVRSTVRQENHMELAMGSSKRSGGQWAIWEAVFGPVGDDGYPSPIWDPDTGTIDSQTAAYWRSNYDLHEYLQNNWETVSSKLSGKLHIAVGDMDSYYLDNAVYMLENFLTSAPGISIDAEIQCGRRKPHCWTGYSPNNPGEDMTTVEFVEIVREHFLSNAPAGADLSWSAD